MSKAGASVIDFFAILGLIVADVIAAGRDLLALLNLGRARPEFAPAQVVKKDFETQTPVQ